MHQQTGSGQDGLYHSLRNVIKKHQPACILFRFFTQEMPDTPFLTLSSAVNLDAFPRHHFRNDAGCGCEYIGQCDQAGENVILHH